MDIKAAILQYNTAMEGLEAAEKNVQVALQNIKATAGSSTVNVEGQFFQVRERRDKLYLCELSGKPKGRPIGSKNTKKKSVVDSTESDLPPAMDFSVEANTVELADDVPVQDTGVRIIDVSSAETVDQATA